MKPKRAKPKAIPTTETFGGDYHRLESTYRLPDRPCQPDNRSGLRATAVAKPKRSASRPK